MSGTSTYYVGNWYEVTNGTATKYYYFGAQRVAMKQGSTLTYLHGDHLGSTSVASTDTGAFHSRQTYYAFGVPRTTEGTLPTDFTFTGQRADSSAGLMYYNARYYDSAIGRFIQADTIVPNVYDPQQLNRYSYARNNPIKYRDPSGHWLESVLDIVFIIADVTDIAHNGLNWENGLSLAADVGGLLLPGVTGGGLAVRALSHADDAADALKAVDRASSLVKATGGSDDIIDVYHATENAQSVLNGIDLDYVDGNNRFRKAFYTAEEGVTAVAEGSRSSTGVIRYKFDRGNAKILDLEDEVEALTFGYNPGAKRPDTHRVRDWADHYGYDTIKYESTKVPGTSNYAIFDRIDKLLSPEMVMPRMY